MKFSWKVLNFFINLEQIPFEEFTKKLNLNGLEIEELKSNITDSDKTIHLNITTNRKEIFCIINLAIEISTIFKLPLKIKLEKIRSIDPCKTYLITSYFDFIFIKIHKVYHLSNTSSPKWLQYYLEACEIKPLSLIYDIKKYIEIKWGYKIYIFNLDKLKNNINISDKKFICIDYLNKIILNKTEHLYFNYEKNYDKKQNIILYFIVYRIDANNILNSSIVFNQVYNETIKLITSNSNSILSKSIEYYNHDTEIKDKNNILNIKKNQIKSILGQTNNQKLTFLSNQEIFTILKQLNYKPVYLHNYKIFKIVVPEYRQHDLKRNIDIIEEIGRIYSFEKFLNKLPNYKNKGSISLNTLHLKKIRNTLIHIGFNEVITSSFITKIDKLQNHIIIHNPQTKDQTNLRINIIENLINNYQQNKKNKIIHTEIFEIGKIFYKNKLNNFIEEIYLGGLIYNNTYLQLSWSKQKQNMKWFHAKGILENFLEIINAKTVWKNLVNVNNSITFQYSQDYYHPNKKIFICNNKNNELIGIFGEIYNKNLKELDIKKTYIFEISVTKLLKCINYNKHYNYIMNPYSLYPSVSRDVSIKIKQKTSIEKIKNLFLDKSTNLLKSIQVINDYYNKSNNTRSVCIRITYRSYYKTLNNTDLNDIDLNIKNILQTLYKPKQIKSKS